jgi:hypothetical protein
VVAKPLLPFVTVMIQFTPSRKNSSSTRHSLAKHSYVQPHKSRRTTRKFVRHHLTELFALIAGIACTAGCIVFTFWLSNQILHCPAWSTNCHIPGKVDYIQQHIGTVQGLVTAVYAIGLAALAYSAHAFSEAALWPLLAKQTLTLNEVETYIQASRGSIPSTPIALFAARSMDAVVILICTMVITLVPLSGAPLVGHVYDRTNISAHFQSQSQPGGGIGPIFEQKNPPVSARDSPGSLYTSWSLGLAPEPMVEHRDWFINRDHLSRRGNMTVFAVRMQQNISCEPSSTLKTVDGNKGDNSGIWFKTKLGKNTGRPGRKASSDKIKVRKRDKLAVWVDDFDFLSPTRTKATLVFAAMNGTIAGGRTMNTEGWKISSIACDVDIELIDDKLVVGTPGDTARPPAQINSLSHLKATYHNDTTFIGRYIPDGSNTLNELALWLAVSPISNGISVEGAQPMYAHGNESDVKANRPPIRYSITSKGNNQLWTSEYITHFIRVSTGATAMSFSSGWFDGEPVTMDSFAYTLKLDPRRPFLLCILPGLILCIGILLCLWTKHLHTQMDVALMRKATLSEFLKSAQTREMREICRTHSGESAEFSQLDAVRVKFGTTGNGSLGLMSVNMGEEVFNRELSNRFRRGDQNVKYGRI